MAPKTTAPKPAAPTVVAPTAAALKASAPRGAAGALPSCGFSVVGSKKGELPLKTEKRAKGKRVTIISNVLGDAVKLVRTLQTMLGVGGTARQAQDQAWTVEVQGEQTSRVTQMLLDFNCLRGVNKDVMAALKPKEDSKETFAVQRTTISKYLAQTKNDDGERLRQMEAEFYNEHYNLSVSAAAADDMSDVWEETLAGDSFAYFANAAPPAESLPELNLAFKMLGMLAETGRAVRDFWAPETGMTISQFRKIALNPGARLITDVAGRWDKPTNLISRQKLSDFRSTGGRGARGNYFSCTCSVIDAYQAGKALPSAPPRSEAPVAEKARLRVETGLDGSSTAVLSYVVPLDAPPNRLEDEALGRIKRRALEAIAPSLEAALASVGDVAPGFRCALDLQAFGVNLALAEKDFLFGGRKETPGKQPDKEEMRLEKKLREIAKLRERQAGGESLEKLQQDKMSTQEDTFRQLAELKLRRAEKQLLKTFAKHHQKFKEAFWNFEMDPGGGDELATRPPPAAVVAFDASRFDGPVAVGADGTEAEGRSSSWQGVCVQLSVGAGEVAAFAVRVVEGVVRIGWAAPDGVISDLGGDAHSFGYGGDGKKCHAGKSEDYGGGYAAGAVIHCEAEREAGVLRIGYAKDEQPLGLAYETTDIVDVDLVGVVCGKGHFKVQLLSAEVMAIDEAPPPILEGFKEYDPPAAALVLEDYRGDGAGDGAADCLELHAGETLYVMSDDGAGYSFGYFLDPEEGGWFPSSCVRVFDEEASAWDAPPAWVVPPLASNAERSGEDRLGLGVGTLSPRTSPQAAPLAAAWAAPRPIVRLLGVEYRVDEDGQVMSLAQMEGKYRGVYNPAEVRDWFLSCASAPEEPDQSQATAPEPPGNLATAGTACAATEEAVKGLAQWLDGMKLQKYEEQAATWCSEMGAYDLEEVKENGEELAEALGLKPLERKRMEKAPRLSHRLHHVIEIT